jgi:hypothetical protein
MKQKWWCIRGVVLCAAALAGCGEEEIDPLDPSTFAGMNAEKVHYDCRQTVQCGIQMGEDQVPDPFNACAKATARHLQDHPESQMEYLIDVNRCQGLVVCDYLTCVRANVTSGFGMQQMENITYNCMQDVECRRQLGTLMSEPTMEVDSCIANNIGILNAFNPDQQRQYVSEFMRCGQALACDFSNCFPF